MLESPMYTKFSLSSPPMFSTIISNGQEFQVSFQMNPESLSHMTRHVRGANSIRHKYDTSRAHFLTTNFISNKLVNDPGGLLRKYHGKKLRRNLKRKA
jgi:hypothetical protein